MNRLALLALLIAWPAFAADVTVPATVTIDGRSLESILSDFDARLADHEARIEALETAGPVTPPPVEPPPVEPPPPPPPSDLPTSTAGVHFAECKAKLEQQGGGWCELSGSKIADVFPTNLSGAQRGWNGPQSVISAWNSAAWDATRRKWYFHGGGHSDYGGNEVYEFDLDAATFTRLTDPAPLADQTPAIPDPLPEWGPRSQHTYDGFAFSKLTQTIWMFPSAAGYRIGSIVNMKGEVWEFNPDRTEARNGIAPLTWRRHPVDMPADLQRNNFLRSAELPDGRFVVWTNHIGATFDPRDGSWVKFGTRPDWGSGNAIYDAARNVIWEASGAFLKYSPVGGPAKETNNPFGIRSGAGLAVGDDGLVYVWSGQPLMGRYDPEAKAWQIARHETGPTGNNVMDKFVWLPADKVFIGYVDAFEGVWVYKPPAEGWEAVRLDSAQSFIDAAPEGSTVTIPPGLYAQGIRIAKDLTVKLDGVAFGSAFGNKANVLVENPDRRITVVIEGYDMPGARTGGNGAGIRADYDFDLTVRNFHVRGSNMGILTGNLGGRLVLEDGRIEEICCGSDLSHGIYAGMIDELIVRRVTVTNLRRLGHLVKSRAKRTTVEDSRLIGGEGRYSREFDLSNGGHIVIRRNVIQKGPNTDNAESIAVGTEVVAGSAHAHQQMLPTSVEFTDNWLIFDRKGVGPEPAWSAGPNQFGKYRNAEGTPMNVSGNRIVGMKLWGEFPDLSAGNEMYADRAAAGLGADEFP